MSDFDGWKFDLILLENINIDNILKKIIKKNNTANDAKNYIQNNINFFSWEFFRQKLIKKLREEINEEKKSMILLILSLIDEINEKEKTKQKIDEIILWYKNKIDSIIDEWNNNEQELKNEKETLKQEIDKKNKEILEQRVIIEKQSDNLKNQIISEEKLNLLIEKYIWNIGKLKKEKQELVYQNKKLEEHLEKLTTFPIKESDENNDRKTEDNSSKIIKAGTIKIERYEYWKIERSDTDNNSTYIESNNEGWKIFEKMLQNIKELEIENQQLLEQKQEEKDFEQIIKNQKKEYEEKIKKLEDELQEKNNLIFKNNLVFSGLKK